MGILLSLVMVLSISGLPKPIIGTKDIVTQESKIQLEAIEYPTKPPEPLEWFHSRSTIRSIPSPSVTPSPETAKENNDEDRRGKTARFKDRLEELKKRFQN